MNEAETILLQLVESSLQGDETAEEIERLACAAVNQVGLPEDVARRVSERIVASRGRRSRREASRAEASGPAATSDTPGLLVDWGTGLQTGWQVCAECQLVCPEVYRSRPIVRVRVDRRLDQDEETERPVLTPEDAGLWSFPIPFALTTAGQDCRPGQYLVEISVVFPTVAPPLPRFFDCRVRLNVFDPERAAAGPTLEIEGEGQSMLNLRGRDLKSFARVVLRGSGNSVLNVQESLFDAAVPAKEPADEDGSNDAADGDLQFAYVLKADTSRNQRVPWFSTRWVRRQVTDAAALVPPDGQRVLLLARRKIKLGRNRDNDIVVRFLPRSEQHDAWSRSISREHVSCRLSQEGLQVADLGSTKGSCLDGDSLRQPRLLTAQDANQDLDLVLASGDQVAMPFRTRLRLIGSADPGRRQDEGDLDETLCQQVLGEPLPPLWNMASSSGIDAVRIERVNNLSQGEVYVLVYRQATIHPSEDAAVRIAEGERLVPHARILHLGGCFWLQNLSGTDGVRIDGHPLAEAETVPLCFGMEILLGDRTLRYAAFEQTHL